MNVFRSSRFFLFRLLAFAIATFLAASAPAQTASPLARQIPAGGQGVFQPQPLGGDGVQAAEIDNLGQDADNDDQQNGFVNRTLPSGTSGNGNSVQAGKKAKSNPQLNFAFDGLNFRQQRLANHGNQFSVEPPDQGLCAGNGFILESTNDVLDVFDASGNQLLGVTDLNSFYGYAPAVVRHVLNGPPAKFGPSVTDPSCLFDVASQRWFHVVLTLDRINVDVNGQSTSQSLSGLNHLTPQVRWAPGPFTAFQFRMMARRALPITTACRKEPRLDARIPTLVSETIRTSEPTPTGSTSLPTNSVCSHPTALTHPSSTPFPSRTWQTICPQ